ncbi:hypothetical protein [Rhodococcus sp. ACT016]|uniref:hypothetical protein n=1 Tax=Rhodococcus sp. ACT016 TaxID=3134808 RepID=UPI003D2665DA
MNASKRAYETISKSILAVALAVSAVFVFLLFADVHAGPFNCGPGAATTRNLDPGLELRMCTDAVSTRQMWLAVLFVVIAALFVVRRIVVQSMHSIDGGHDRQEKQDRRDDRARALARRFRR